MALKISFTLIFVIDLGFLNYQFIAFFFMKFSANFIKMHECYLLSVEFYMVVVVANLVTHYVT